VQVVRGSRRGARTIEHIGSAHDELELEALKAAARQRLADGQEELELGLEASASAVAVSAAGSARPLQIASSRMGHLWDGLSSAYDLLGFARAAGGDEVFRQLVLARIIEPTSKQDSLRVLAEVGVDAVSYPTLNRHLRGYAAEGFRRKLAAACAAHAKLGPASLVLYDVSTLYFETDAGDGFREPGFWQGTPARTSDHDRPTHRRVRVPADGGGVRGQPGRDHHDAAHDHLVHGRPQAARRHDRGRRGDDL
jgi:hypothetical protein